MKKILAQVEKAYNLNENDTDSYFDYKEMYNCLIKLEKLVKDKEIELQASKKPSNCILDDVSERYTPLQMAKFFHDNYEEIANSEGWKTQDKCKVEFEDLPEANKQTMLKVCERWLNAH